MNTPYSLTWETYYSREEWLDARKTFVGASEIADILGGGRRCAYGDDRRYSVWHCKVNPAPDRGTLRMRKGLLMEPLIAEVFEQRAGHSVIRMPGWRVVRHPECPHFAVTPDAFVNCDRFETVNEYGPLELKDVNEYVAAGDWRGGPPLHVELQVQAQMEVCGMDFAYVAALVNIDEDPDDPKRDDYFLSYRIERDREMGAVMLEEVREFWGWVERREAPPPDGSRETTQAIRNMFPRATDDVINAQNETAKRLEELNERYLTNKATIKRAQHEQQRAGNALRLMIGAAAGIRHPDGWGYSYKCNAAGVRILDHRHRI